MEKTTREDRLSAIERKIDLILDAMGLSGKKRMTPREINEIADSIVMQFRVKQKEKKNREGKKK
jgi:hypothetical protein